MAAPDYVFTEGFDKLGGPGIGSISTNLLMGEWSTYTQTQGGGNFAIVAALTGTGYALDFTLPNDSSGRTAHFSRNFPANYGRVLGGVTYKLVTVNNGQPWGFTYYDGATAQFSITMNADGTISLRRGDDDGTVIATSAEAPGTGTTHCVTWNVVPHGSAGTATVYLDGVPLTNLNGLTGLDLTNTANNYVNAFRFGSDVGGTTQSGRAVFDHLWSHLYLSSATTPDSRPLVGNPVVEAQTPVATVASDFTPVRDTLGNHTRYGTSVASPAANSLILRKITAVGDSVLNTMRITPNATNAGAKFKGVIYADNGSGTAPAAAAPLDVGAEVVGCTSGVALDSDMNDIALVDGTTYWIGFIMDTSLSMQLEDANATGYRAANTYTSGAPNPPPALTAGQGSWYIYGLITPDETWSALKEAPQSTLAYNKGSAVGQREELNFGALSVNPAEVYSVSHKFNMRRTDAGSRTIKVGTKSDGTEVQASAVAPATSGMWVVDGNGVDPATGLPWTAAGVAASSGTLEIIT